MDMSERREFLLTGLMSLGASVLSGGSAMAAPAARQVAQRDTPAVSLDGWQITISEVTYPPGEQSAVHRHPGFVVGYVLEGEYRFAVDQNAPQTLAPGQAFFESFDAPGQVHAVSGNASPTRPARILALVFTKKGDPTTIPGA